jgi:hypothetical protein
LAEVCKVITAPVTNGYYPVYTDVKRGSAVFCAYHGVGMCGAVSVQFAFFFNLDGDASCDPADTSGLHSQGLAALKCQWARNVGSPHRPGFECMV